MRRGIIANSAKTERIDAVTVTIGSTISAEDINYYTLYWDELIIPTNNLIKLSVPNENILISSGVLKRPEVQFSSWSSNESDGSYDMFLESQLRVAKDILSKPDETDWTLHQIGDANIITDKFNMDFNSIKVSLVNCLPVPNETATVEQILRFKQTRKDELLALHESIDELYFDILKSPDRILQSKKSLAELKKAIRDLETTCDENFTETKKYDFSTEININGKDIAVAAGGGAILDLLTPGVTLPIATILSTLLSLVTIKASRSKSFEPAKDKMKLSYLANAHKKGLTV